ncbi:MAG TPA: phosphopantetheine-binding protein [Pseudonocardiaceae bacterium]|nr:phosphopantetheine-binding protein [Pseudonocardiaceae bacterium]
MRDIVSSVAVVCRDAMGVTDLHADDDLVARGADSLVAVEIVSKLQLDYGVDVADIFLATPTIAALAQAVTVRVT